MQLFFDVDKSLFTIHSSYISTPPPPPLPHPAASNEISTSSPLIRNILYIPFYCRMHKSLTFDFSKTDHITL